MNLIEDAYPLSSTQQGMLFHSLLAERSDAYLSVISVQLEGELNFPVFKNAWQCVFQHHPTLRSAVVVDGMEQPLWVVHESIDPSWEVLDHTKFEVAESSSRINQILSSLEETRFDFAADVLMKFTLVKHSDSNHQLLWTIHHLISDGWSTAVVFEDLANAYSALIQNDAVKLQPALDYRDFVRFISEKNHSLGQEYWSNYLTGRVPTEIHLPNSLHDKPRKLKSSVQLGKTKTRAVKEAARRYECTVSVLYLAAWGLVLRDYAQTASPMYGVTLAGRPTELPAVERGVGLYTNTVPFCIDFPESNLISEWLSSLLKSLNSHAEHASVPLIDIQKSQHDGSNNSLFSSVVTVNGHHSELGLDNAQVGGLKIVSLDYHIRSHFDISLLITPSDVTNISLLSQTADIDLAAHKGILNKFESALDRLTACSGKSVHSLLNTTPNVPTSFSCTVEKTHPYKRMEDWIISTASKNASLVALQQGEQSLTYSELAIRTDQLARALEARKIEPSQSVAISLPNSIDAVVAMLGIMSAGLSYVVIDASQSEDRTNSICKRANSVLVITDNSTSEWPCLSTDMRSLEQEVRVRSESKAFRGRCIKQFTSNTAYLLFTSGSTGTPKGVSISHENLIYSTAARFKYYKQRVESYLMVSPLHFDSSVAGIFWTLCSGGKLVLPDADNQKDLAHWSEIVQNNRVTHTLCLPSVYRLWLAQTNASDLRSLHTVIVAGEPTDSDLCAVHRQTLPVTKLYNEYGPTECCVWSSVYECQDHDSNPVPIGLPIPGTEIHIIGFDGRNCPDGVEGEIQIVSAGVAEGYICETKLTAEKFSKNPSSYLTGDLGYRYAEGDIVCTGRIDRQIKIRGQRIEPGEIESCTRKIDGIDSAHAFLFDEPSRKKKQLMLAYSPDTVSVEVVEANLKSDLPEVMRPFGLFALAELPKLSNGKVCETTLKKQVPKPVQYRAPGKPTINPSAAIEESVIEAIKVLVPEIQPEITDNVVISGLDSIDAMKLTARLREDLNVDLRLKTVLETDSWRSLAAHIDSLSFVDQSEVSTSHQDSKLKNPISDVMTAPASVEQKSLWYATQTSQASNVYAIQSSVEVAGELLLESIQYALDALVQHHGILRTRVRLDESGDLEQVVFEPEPVKYTFIDGGSVNTSWSDAQLTQLNMPFNLEHDQLFRALVYRCDEKLHRLMIHSHHIALDGWSFDLLLQQLFDHYQHHSNENTDISSLAESTLSDVNHVDKKNQYLAYSRKQHNESNSSHIDDLAYWRKVLALPRETLSLPFANSLSSLEGSQGDSVVVPIAASVTEQWAGLASQTHSSPFVVVLGSLKLAIRKITNAEDVRIGTPVSNRLDSEWDQTCGFFSDTVVIRTNGSAENSLVEEIGATATAVKNALQHKGVHYSDIVQEMGLSGKENTSPLFDVYFIYQHRPKRLPSHRNLDIRPVAEPRLTAAKFPISIEIRPAQGSDLSRYELHLNYNCHLFSRSSAYGFASKLVNAMVDIPLIETPNYEDHSNWQSPTLTNGTISSLFDSIVQRSASAVALIHNEVATSYEKLNNWVNIIEYQLLNSGLLPGEIVVLSLPRSTHQIAAAIAISRCKAVWCPVDPKYPNAVKAAIVSHSGARIILSDEKERALGETSSLLVSMIINTSESIDVHNPVATTLHSSDLSQKQLEECDQRVLSSTALLMYTSGSTGEPKGVLLGHEALVNRILWMWLQYPFAANEVNIVKTSCSFVDSLWESFGALLAGIPSVIVNDDSVENVETFISILQEKRVTRLLVVPSLLSAILEWLRATQQDLPNLKICTSSGEALPAQLIEEYFRIQSNSRLLNLYGCTEVMGDATCYEVDFPHEFENIPVGTPISGMKILVLDQNREIVSPGTRGEIAVAGVGLAQGYLRPKDDSQGKFIELANLGRVFMTGDYGRLDGLGRLYFGGREDSQVKVRGVRIDCSFVECSINSLPNVETCLVFAMGEMDNRQLCVLVQRKSNITNELHTAHSGIDDVNVLSTIGNSIDISTHADDSRLMSNSLKKLLPRQHIPDKFYFATVIPLLPNGKLDRVLALGLIENSYDNYVVGEMAPADTIEISSKLSNRLLANSSEKPSLAPAVVIPSSQPSLVFEHLLTLWREILKSPKLKSDDDFFDSGGYSLLAVKLVLRINSEYLHAYSVKVSLSDLLSHRSAGTMYEYLEAAVSQSVSNEVFEENSSLTQLQSGTGNNKVFMFPPFGHTSLYMQKFASVFSDDLSVHAIEYNICVEHNRMEDVCAYFVDEILKVEPKGPWTLIGVCFGNIVAFECAKQLFEKTGVICDLNIIDSRPPRKGPEWDYQSGIVHTGISKYLKILFTEVKKDLLRSIIKRNIRKIRARKNDAIQLYFDIQVAQGIQYENYKGIEIASNICMFRSENSVLGPNDEQRWKSLTKGSFMVQTFLGTSHKKLVDPQSAYWEKIAALIVKKYNVAWTENLKDEKAQLITQNHNDIRSISANHGKINIEHTRDA